MKVTASTSIVLVSVYTFSIIVIYLAKPAFYIYTDSTLHSFFKC